MRRVAVSLVLLATLGVAGCTAKPSSDGNYTSEQLKLGVRLCKAHGGLQTALYSDHGGGAAVVCRDGHVFPVDFK